MKCFKNLILGCTVSLKDRYKGGDKYYALGHHNVIVKCVGRIARQVEMIFIEASKQLNIFHERIDSAQGIITSSDTFIYATTAKSESSKCPHCTKFYANDHTAKLNHYADTKFKCGSIHRDLKRNLGLFSGEDYKEVSKIIQWIDADAQVIELSDSDNDVIEIE